MSSKADHFRAWAVRLAFCLTLADLTGCQSLSAQGRERCELLDEIRVADASSPVVHDIALVPYRDGLIAFWSERAGLFARSLDRFGVPTAEAERLGRACEAGVDAVARADSIQLACGHRARDAKDDLGGLHRIDYRPGESSVTSPRLGAMGNSGSGVALARDSDGQWFLGWQHGEGASRETWLQSESEPPQRLSRFGSVGSAPALLGGPFGVLAAWSETRAHGRDVEGHVLMRRYHGSERGRVREVADVSWEQTLPALTEGPFLTFRDRKPARSRPRIRFARVDPEALQLGRIEQGVHANADGEASLVLCNGIAATIAPRTHARRERLVSVRPYDTELWPKADELQLYQFAMVYEHAEARCVDERLLVLIAGRRAGGSGTVRISQVVCGR